MCIECWKELGKPKMRTPQIERCAELVDELYQFNPVGGHLHIVTDDWNLEDHSVEFCRKYVEEQEPTEQTHVEAQIIQLMQPMSEEERGAVLAISSGFVDEID